MTAAARSANRRGAAMLIVLATLMITMTAITILARAASTWQLQRQIEEGRTVADDLLAAADAPIQRWLNEESGKAVAPAEAVSPRFEVLTDGMAVNGMQCTLRITAFDQLGMLALDAARSGSPLRLSVSADCLRRVDQLGLSMNGPIAGAGLDWFIAPDDSESTICRIFPDAQPTIAPALGEVIATHNVLPGDAEHTMMNINTAALTMVEAALRLAGRGGIENISAARKQGRLSNIGSPTEPSGTTATPNDDPFKSHFVSTSSCWSFRIDVQAGPLRRSWWAVYQAGQASPDHGKWECVQRLAITE